MIRIAAALIGAVAGVAVAALDWQPIGFSASGSWDVVRSTVALQMVNGKPHITAVGRVVRGDTEIVYTLAVPPGHCGRPMGDVLLLAPDGRVAQSSMFAASNPSTGTRIAEVLCTEYQNRRLKGQQ